jgi:hypothetical protein
MAQKPDERIIKERNSTPEQAHLCYLFGMSRASRAFARPPVCLFGSTQE